VTFDVEKKGTTQLTHFSKQVKRLRLGRAYCCKSEN
jgi:hypothetical protein